VSSEQQAEAVRAAALFLADGTVKNHRNVLTKLDARDRTQAALHARALGLV
jgi:DNA-binding NarL/FixJ family response regulator